MTQVQVVRHDPEWAERFDAEAERISQKLRSVVVRLHHIGSTAIPEIPAKPIIDILMEVVDLGRLDQSTAAMEELGYEAMGEYGIPGRRYFRKNGPAGQRLYQVHAFDVGSKEAERHIAFRDYMIAHPTAARAYGELKMLLAQRHPDDTEAYMGAKDAFVKEHEALAIASLTANRPGASTT
jgi:GrpB-like predicted nucleotidyltransferase (UPF0157 family)